MSINTTNLKKVFNGMLVGNTLKPQCVQRDEAFEVRMQADRKRGVTLSQMCGVWGVGRVERDPVERKGRMQKWGRIGLWDPCERGNERNISLRTFK